MTMPTSDTPTMRRWSTSPQLIRSEVKAKEKGLNYVKLSGEVGIIGNGAGLVMSTLDVVAYAGEEHGGVKPANFLDIGGGASAGDGRRVGDHPGRPRGQERVRQRLRGHHLLRRCRKWHRAGNGMLAERGDAVDKPIVCRLDGNNAAEGRRILDEAEHDVIELVDTMDEAAARVAELAAR